MSRIGEPSWKSVYDKSVDIKFAETHWPVYQAEAYQLWGTEGDRYICVRKLVGEPVRRRVKSVDPLAPEYAGLFLEFARWFDKQKMEKVKLEKEGISTLDTERNAQAALLWMRKYGALGLGPNLDESFAVGGSPSSAQIAAKRLGVPRLGHDGTRAYRQSPIGGEDETIEAFALEAYEANIVLKLYEAATASTVDVPAITRFMDKVDNDDVTHLRARYGRVAKTERELWSQEDELTQDWALRVVENAVHRKIENDVYSILIGDPYSYKEGWGFKSLLGAMWFQMRGFMLGEDNLCDWCGHAFVKSRRDKRHCDEVCAGRHRAHRAYERKKLRQEAARAATKRKLSR